jgi:3-hydroxyisobutyrate dehydrogenase
MKIAFVGLGSMGSLMARNLVRAGFEVTGFDANPSAMEALRRIGGTVASSAAAAAENADILILMVVNAAQAQSVLFTAGALVALVPDGVVLLMATCPPGRVRELATAVTETGRGFVDSPVSGGTAGAEGATLSIMAAADNATMQRVRPVLASLGSEVFHVGTEPGQAAVVKAVNQLLCGVHIAVAAEGMALARKVGIDPAIILKILGGSAASSWMLKDRGPRMMEEEPKVSSAVDIFVKDLGIVLETGGEAKAALPLAAVAHQMFVAASGRGEGARDDSQVIRSYALLNGG